MNLLQACKFDLSLPPQSINGTDTYTSAMDTAGMSEICVLFMYGVSTAAMDNLALYECETSGGTYTAVTGGGFSVMPSATDDNKCYAVYVKIGAHARYLKLRVDPGAAATLVGVVGIGLPNITPNTATERGLADQIILG